MCAVLPLGFLMAWASSRMMYLYRERMTIGVVVVIVVVLKMM
jgi:hypothetical protein